VTGNDNNDFFADIGWPPAGLNDDGTPWYMIPPDVLRIELERRGLDAGGDSERRVQHLDWGKIMADWPDQSKCLLILSS